MPANSTLPAELNAVIAQARAASPERASCLLLDVRPIAHTGSLLGLLPLIDTGDDRLSEQVVEALLRATTGRKALARGLAERLPALRGNRKLLATALHVLMQLDLAASEVFMRETSRDADPWNAAIGLASLIHGEFFRTTDGEVEARLSDNGLEILLGAFIRIGASEAIADLLSRHPELRSQLDVAMMHAGISPNFLEHVEWAFKADRELVGRYLVPTLDGDARRRSRAVLSSGDLDRIHECIEDPKETTVPFVVERARYALQLAREESPEFASFAVGLEAALGTLSRDDPRTETLYALQALGLAMRAGPPSMEHLLALRTVSIGELRRLSIMDRPWWHTSLLTEMARRLPIEYWEELTHSADLLVRVNACMVRFILEPTGWNLSRTIDAPRWLTTQTIVQRCARFCGAPLLEALCEQHNEFMRMEASAGVVMSALELGPAARDVLDRYAADLDLPLDSTAWRALAAHTGSERALKRFLREPRSGTREYDSDYYDLLTERFPTKRAAIRGHERHVPEVTPPARIERHLPELQPYQRAAAKVGRNDPCPCGSGRKYKKCCLAK